MPGPPTPMPLPQSFLAMLIPVIDPQRNGTAMHLQVISYFSRGLPIQAHQNPLDAQHYSRFLILLCLASNFQQLGDGGLISVRECWAHIAHHCSFLDRKSTRLNSSHPSISYAVFCLKKKNTLY